MHGVQNGSRRGAAQYLKGWKLGLSLGPVLGANPPDILFTYKALIEHPEVSRAAGGWVYRGQFFADYLHMGGASHMIAREALRVCKGRGVDIGAGIWPLPGAIPIDIWRGPGAERSLEQVSSGELDYIFSSHCLEHIDDWETALTDWTKLVRPGGKAFLYLPHPDCLIWQPGSPFVGNEHRWSPSPLVIKDALQERGLEVEAADDGPDHYWSFFVCAAKPAAGHQA